MTFFQTEYLWLYLPLMLWIGGIFYLSSEKGSISNTARRFSPILHSLFPKAGEKSLKTYHLVFRKLCHFFGYGILAIFAAIVFYNSSIVFLAKNWQISSLVMVFLIASADEIKQSFYPNRDGSISDVALDCIGGLTLILLFWMFVSR